jgi:hypothetical protein
MKRPAKSRHQRGLNADISKRLDTLAARPVAAESAILPDGVRAWPTKRATHEFDDQIGRSEQRVRFAGVAKRPGVTRTSGGGAPLARRGMPDVSGDADPETGYAVRIDGTDTVIGGTSAVAPL